MKRIPEYDVMALCVLAFVLCVLFSEARLAVEGLNRVLDTLDHHLQLVALVRLAELIARGSKAD
ncbi:hypothetical protein [Deinococcus aetherius]|uniref:hypothetical protein n=1 Tax=Deinococcus aetherius TaxID=200252 RepID=UPI00222FED94|nr:hypothetical protein [Deinococcus aetherius]